MICRDFTCGSLLSSTAWRSFLYRKNYRPHAHRVPAHKSSTPSELLTPGARRNFQTIEMVIAAGTKEGMEQNRIIVAGIILQSEGAVLSGTIARRKTSCGSQPVSV
jgi:hypothetical protein